MTVNRCKYCGGTGKKISSSSQGGGIQNIFELCIYCQGKGFIFKRKEEKKDEEK